MDHGVERLLSKHLENAKDIFRLHKRGMLMFSADKGRELENKCFSSALFYFAWGEINTNAKKFSKRES